MTPAQRQAVLATCLPFALLAFVTPWVNSPLVSVLILCLSTPAVLIAGMAIATPTEETHR